MFIDQSFSNDPTAMVKIDMNSLEYLLDLEQMKGKITQIPNETIHIMKLLRPKPN